MTAKEKKDAIRSHAFAKKYASQWAAFPMQSGGRLKGKAIAVAPSLSSLVKKVGDKKVIYTKVLPPGVEFAFTRA
jgi:hypothetical protein